MTVPVTPYSDAGEYFAGALLAAVQQGITAAGLSVPSQSMLLHGTDIPITDPGEDDGQPCGGILYVRVNEVRATDGDGNLFVESRIDWHPPAFAYSMDVGLYYCRTVIDSAGNAPGATYETEIAIRDGNYRMALLSGIYDFYKPLVAPLAMSRTVTPWQPIGPDGGISGGIIGVTVIAAMLAVPNGA